MEVRCTRLTNATEALETVYRWKTITYNNTQKMTAAETRERRKLGLTDQISYQTALWKTQVEVQKAQNYGVSCEELEEGCKEKGINGNLETFIKPFWRDTDPC